MKSLWRSCVVHLNIIKNKLIKDSLASNNHSSLKEAGWWNEKQTVVAINYCLSNQHQWFVNKLQRKNSTPFKLPINIHTNDIRDFAGTSNYQRAHKHTPEESPPNLRRLASWKTQDGAEAWLGGGGRTWPKQWSRPISRQLSCLWLKSHHVSWASKNPEQHLHNRIRSA